MARPIKGHKKPTQLLRSPNILGESGHVRSRIRIAKDWQRARRIGVWKCPKKLLTRNCLFGDDPVNWCCHLHIKGKGSGPRSFKPHKQTQETIMSFLIGNPHGHEPLRHQYLNVPQFWNCHFYLTQWPPGRQFQIYPSNGPVLITNPPPRLPTCWFYKAPCENWSAYELGTAWIPEALAPGGGAPPPPPAPRPFSNILHSYGT